MIEDFDRLVPARWEVLRFDEAMGVESVLGYTPENERLVPFLKGLFQ